VDPVAFLTIAERFQASNSEAERRTSVGRSYYALYNLLFGSFASRGIHFEARGNDHGRLVYYLTQCGYPQASAIGMTLRDLRNYRNEADYRMNTTVDSGQSQLVYGKAKGAVDDFHQLLRTDIAMVIQRIKRLRPYRPPSRP